MNLEEAIHKLLGVPRAEQPVDCYRLLGIARFEQDAEVIRNAAARQVLYVRQLASGRFAEVAPHVIDQITAARTTLLNPARRRLYDAELREGHVEPPTLAAAGVLAGAASSGTKRKLASPKKRRRKDRAASGAKGPAMRLAASPARREIEALTEATPSDILGSPAEEETKHGHAPRQWVVGVDSACDLVIKSPFVSRRHCRIWETEGLYWVEDLGSRNGTHVNQKRVDGRQVVDETDIVTLGAQARMPWPPQATSASQPKQRVRIITLGRAKANDVVLRDPSVSRHHAQLTVFEDKTILEDLDSTNGTYVGGSELRIHRQPVIAEDVLRVGRFHLSVRQLLDGGPIE